MTIFTDIAMKSKKVGNVKNFIFSVLLTILTVNCSHMNIQVTSNPPEAEVILHTKSGSQKIGKTPLTIPDSQLSNLNDGFTVEVSKEGYFQQKVLVEKRSINSSAELTVKLNPHPKFDFKKSDPEVLATIEEIARQVSSIQAFLLKRDYNQAEVLAKSLLNQYPNLAVGWSLLGNNYYLQGRFAEATSQYQRALEIEPNNQETRDILSKMNRAPSSEKER